MIFLYVFLGLFFTNLGTLYRLKNIKPPFFLVKYAPVISARDSCVPCTLPLRLSETQNILKE